MRRCSRRMEALPLSWDNLSESQLSAVSQVCTWLVDAIEMLPKGDDEATHRDRRSALGTMRLIDDRRCSQIAFVDGDRGTGKSSILLTLQKLTLDPEFARNTASLPAAVKDLYERRRRVVWLEALDMEPLSAGTNLFAALLARVAEVLGPPKESETPIAACLDDLGNSRNAASLLQQLQTDVALVWDRLDGTTCQIGDPQTRAVWVNDAERAGLSLNRRMGEVLEGVARTLPNYHAENPLFILPVDDFDLAPAYCLELLRLIRMVMTPRLFFVVAGNTRIAESVLMLRSEGELRRLARLDGTDNAEVRARAVEVAANNMRKLVPPGQRVRLGRLLLSEARRVGEVALGDNAPGNSLEKLLHAVTFESNQAPTDRRVVSLAEFLGLRQKYVRILQAAEWLAGTPRQVLDLVKALETIYIYQLNQESIARLSQGPNKANEWYAERLVTTLLEEIGRQVQEERQLTFDQRERLTRMLDTSSGVSLDFESCVVPDARYEKRGDTRKFEYGYIVHFEPIDVRLDLSHGTNIPYAKLPSRLSAALLFAHDLLVSLWGGYLRHSTLTYMKDTGPSVQVRWNLADTPGSIVLWRYPRFWCFRDVERFTHHWSLHSGQCKKDFGLAWLASLLEVALDEECRPGAPGLSRQRLNVLLSRVASEEPERTARSVLRHSLLVAVTLLFTPESMTDLVLEEFARGSFITAIRDSGVREEVRRSRAGDCKNLLRRDGPLTLPEAALCSAIAPALAREIAVVRLNMFLKRLDNSAIGYLTDKLTEFFGFGGIEQNKKNLPVLTLEQDIATLLDKLGKLTDIQQNDQLKSELAALRLMWTAPYRDHPFNQYNNGAFVPTQADFDDVRRSDS